MAFYKKIGEEWFEANIVSNSNYTLDESNKQSIDGWEWHDTPPTAYTEWKKIQDEEITDITDTP